MSLHHRLQQSFDLTRSARVEADWRFPLAVGAKRQPTSRAAAFLIASANAMAAVPGFLPRRDTRYSSS